MVYRSAGSFCEQRCGIFLLLMFAIIDGALMEPQYVQSWIDGSGTFDVGTYIGRRSCNGELERALHILGTTGVDAVLLMGGNVLGESDIPQLSLQTTAQQIITEMMIMAHALMGTIG